MVRVCARVCECVSLGAYEFSPILVCVCASRQRAGGCRRGAAADGPHVCVCVFLCSLCNVHEREPHIHAYAQAGSAQAAADAARRLMDELDRLGKDTPPDEDDDEEARRRAREALENAAKNLRNLTGVRALSLLGPCY